MILILTLSAAIALAFGNIFQKISLSKTYESISLRNPLSFAYATIKNWKWIFGILLSTYGTLAYMTAMSKWNLSIVQPLMCLNPVLTAIIGRYWLKENLDKLIVIAIVWNVLGLVLVGTQTSEALGNSQGQYIWQFSISLIVAFTVLIYFATNHHEFKDACIAGMGFGMSAVFWKYISFRINWDGVRVFEGSAWYEVLLTPGLYFYIIAYVVGFIFSQVALSRGRTVFVVPLSTAIGTFIPILAGWVVFQEPISSIKIIAMISIFLGSLFFIKAGAVAGRINQT